MPRATKGNNIVDASDSRWDDIPWDWGVLNCIGSSWLDEPSALSWGCPLERIREYYNFWLGTKLSRLDHLRAGMSVEETGRLLYPVRKVMDHLSSTKYNTLPMCVDHGIALTQALDEVFGPAMKSPKDSGWQLPEMDLLKIREAAKALDTAISIQFDHLDTYLVTPKGTHDTRKLIETPEVAFESHWPHVVVLAQSDWRSASRCLAFDLPTACGFHAIRAMEAQVLGYLQLKSVTPKKRDLGHYVELLRQEKAGSEAVNLVDHLRANHRNPLMHPEDTLDLPEALSVFDLTKTAIMYLIIDGKAKGIIA